MRNIRSVPPYMDDVTYDLHIALMRRFKQAMTELGLEPRIEHPVDDKGKPYSDIREAPPWCLSTWLPIEYTAPECGFSTKAIASGEDLLATLHSSIVVRVMTWEGLLVLNRSGHLGGGKDYDLSQFQDVIDWLTEIKATADANEEKEKAESPQSYAG